MALSLPEACYRAEGVLHPLARRFPTMQSIEDYVVALVDSDWFAENFPWVYSPPIIEARSSSATFSVCSGNVIAIANNPEHRILTIVLHELAHYVTSPEDGHGAKWRGTFLTLVRREMGFPAYIALRDAYRAENLPEPLDIRFQPV